MDLVTRMLEGDRLALARLITRVENRTPEIPEIMRAVFARTGRAHVLGMTGPPGAGKSTLVDRLTTLLRREGLSAGIIAVDPSSKDVDWEGPVLATQGANDVGVGELLEAIKRHRAALEQGGALETRRQARRRAELEAVLVEEFTAQVMARVRTDRDLARTLEAVSAGSVDPYSAVAQILASTLR